MPKQKTVKERKIKAWMYDYGENNTPSISYIKPPEREVKCANVYGVKVYEVEITIKKEIK